MLPVFPANLITKPFEFDQTLKTGTLVVTGSLAVDTLETLSNHSILILQSNSPTVLQSYISLITPLWLDRFPVYHKNSVSPVCTVECGPSPCNGTLKNGQYCWLIVKPYYTALPTYILTNLLSTKYIHHPPDTGLKVVDSLNVNLIFILNVILAIMK